MSSVELEDLTASHAPLLFEGLSDAELYSWIEEEPPANVETLVERYRMLERRTSPDETERWLNWAVRLRGSGEYIGYVQATVGPDAAASIAYVIFRQYWGRGLAEEAVTLMLGRLRDHFGVRVARANVDQRNHRSINLLRKLHFNSRKCGPMADRVFELPLVGMSRS
jgi:RimJ/RimL family protein N-acetyltransferase